MIKSIVCLILIFFVQISNGTAQPEIYIFRHGEKLEPWNTQQFDSFQPLSEKGMQTAEHISKLFQNKKVSAVYSSKTTRTLTTGWPLSQSQNLTISFHAACSDTTLIANFMSDIFSTYKTGDIIVIISHSNIIPYFLIQFGATEKQFSDLEISYSDQYKSYLTNTYGSYWRITSTSGNSKYKIERHLITE